ncbi:NCS2 family permease [Sedimentibacter sp. zth1]|uniref:NCS2 family permease n=1 Tax=Sedimentibacter sp. zth1 TaxID=2816908 RepID=UPI001A92BEBE|nr:NCS2 family permease [Sedimentibacter sp. zth1]QSX04976.1 NCS2 family permease [Sedimentibacter sp. zth1]
MSKIEETSTLDRIFKLKENNTTVKTEILAGITTFMTMAYILAVNPNILAAAHMDKGAVLIATALASFIGTILMAVLSNYPFALAPGMGLNAYFAFTVCGTMGYSWQIALLAVFVEGIIFIILSLTNVREAIFNAIPLTLKSAVSVGIGLFIAFIGLQNAKIVVNHNETLVTIQTFSGELFNSVGVGAILALVGVIITAILIIKNVKGGILLGILSTWVLGIICELLGFYIPNVDAGMFSVIPSKIISFDFSALGNTFGQFFKADFSAIKVIDFIVIMFAFLFVDLFDTLGTLIGVSSKANMLDKDGKLPRIKGALLADSIATSAGAILGTSTTTTYVESASGVTAGGRTGLTGIVTAILFLLATIFSPLFLTIPSFATAPALIIVGFYMLGNVSKIDFNDMTDAIPAFLCIIAMPLTYSISEGISIGVISWTLINLITGKAKEKKISILMYVLSILFVLKYIFL